MFDKDGGLLGNFDSSAKSSSIFNDFSWQAKNHTGVFSSPNPFGTTANSANPSLLKKAGEAVSSGDNATFNEVANAIVSPANSGYVVSSTPDWTYLNADLAQHYGMDKVTAYQEALANTSHQREVADLKAAGLNPVLSASGGNGAAVFGASGVSDAGAVISSGANSGKGVAAALVGLTTLLATKGNVKVASAAAGFTSVLEGILS